MGDIVALYIDYATDLTALVKILKVSKCRHNSCSMRSAGCCSFSIRLLDSKLICEDSCLNYYEARKLSKAEVLLLHY